MAHVYPSRVAANILPLSRSQALPTAFAEWTWAGTTHDHGRPSERCELCEQESLRYHFEIRNELTGKALQVGSQCILRWQVGVVAGDVRVGREAARTLIVDAVKRMQREACTAALRSVLSWEPHPVLQGALDAYVADKALTPKQVSVVFWRLDVAGIEYHPSFFRVDLKTKRRRNDLKAMPDYQRERAWRAMTSAQRKSAIAWGIPAPASFHSQDGSS